MLKMVLALGGMLALAAPAQAQVNSADLKWGPALPVFPAGAQMAVSGMPQRTALSGGREEPSKEDRRLEAAVRWFLDVCRKA